MRHNRLEAPLALASGLLFGLGLIAGGMTDPLKVKAFLDLFGAWDPSLALVMGGAIAVGVFAFAAGKRRSLSFSGHPIEWPTNTTIDARLLLGGVLFGAGWGLGGFCPGPALVALGSGFAPAGVFVAAMLAGMALHDRFLAR
ncbi:MAG: DUF6691 family protein [Rubrivivax sp.]|jgi:uncharacterized membrane protein YedE/YeeE